MKRPDCLFFGTSESCPAQKLDFIRFDIDSFCDIVKESRTIMS